MRVYQRLEYPRLAEGLAERALVDPAVSQQLLVQCAKTGELFSELLVSTNQIADWELSRVVCEMFGLAFLPTDVYEPSRDARKGIDPAFLYRHCLVPLDRVGPMLSVAMPALVSAEVLSQLAHTTKASVIPLVGSVVSNRRWLETNLQAAPLAAPKHAQPGAAPVAHGDLAAEGDWLNLFDTADEQVQQQLKRKQGGAGKDAA